MTRPRILVSNRVHAEVAGRLAAAGELDMNTSIEPWTGEELRARIPGATALMGFMPDCVDQALLDQAPQLRIVACALKGFDNYDIDACTRAGVWVSIVPDLLIAPTAELALGLAIGLARQIRPADLHVRSGSHRSWRAAFFGSGLEGSTAGIVGMGRLGRAIADRLAGFGCKRILGVDTDAVNYPAVTECGLEAALSESDYLFLATPLTMGSIGLLNSGTLSMCKHGQMVINVGRGSVVDEEAVAEALANGQLGGYAADVFAFEDWALPGRPRGIPARLLSMDNTLFTPHLGSAVRNVRLAIEQCAADNILAVLAGDEPPDAINRPVAAVPGGTAVT